MRKLVTSEIIGTEQWFPNITGYYHITTLCPTLYLPNFPHSFSSDTPFSSFLQISLLTLETASMEPFKNQNSKTEQNGEVIWNITLLSCYQVKLDPSILRVDLSSPHLYNRDCMLKYNSISSSLLKQMSTRYVGQIFHILLWRCFILKSVINITAFRRQSSL